MGVSTKAADIRASLAEKRASASRRFEYLREKELAIAAPVISRDAALQAMLSRIKIQSGVLYGEAEGVEISAGLPYQLGKEPALIS